MDAIKSASDRPGSALPRTHKLVESVPPPKSRPCTVNEVDNDDEDFDDTPRAKASRKPKGHRGEPGSRPSKRSTKASGAGGSAPATPKAAPSSPSLDTGAPAPAGDAGAVSPGANGVVFIDDKSHAKPVLRVKSMDDMVRDERVCLSKYAVRTQGGWAQKVVVEFVALHEPCVSYPHTHVGVRHWPRARCFLQGVPRWRNHGVWHFGSGCGQVGVRHFRVGSDCASPAGQPHHGAHEPHGAGDQHWPGRATTRVGAGCVGDSVQVLSGRSRCAPRTSASTGKPRQATPPDRTECVARVMGLRLCA